MLSPVRYGQRKFRPGGTAGSTFSLIAVTLGTGTIGFPYVIEQNGYIFGPILIVIGAWMSWYTGMCIVKSAEATGRNRYEDIAMKIYGKKTSRVTSWLNFICLIFFAVAFVVYVKNAIPNILLLYITKDKLGWLAKTDFMDPGGIFWASLFSFLVLFPLSIPRNASTLRYSSLAGVLCSMYLTLAIVIVFWTNKKVVDKPLSNMGKIKPFNITTAGILNSFPVVIFAYMY